MIDVAFDAGGPADARRHVGLTGQPGDETVGHRVVRALQGPAIGAKGGGKRRGHLGHRGQADLHQGLGAGDQRLLVQGVHAPVGQHILLQGVEPAVEDAAEGAFAGIRRGDALDQAAVDRLHAVQGRLGLRDLHLAGRKPPAARSFLQPAAEEGLAGPVLPAHRLEHAPAERGRGQFVIQGLLEALSPDGEGVQPVPGHGPATQGIDDLGPSLRTKHVAPANWNCTRSSSLSSCTCAAVSSRVSTRDWSTFRTRRAAFTNPLTRSSGIPILCASAVLLSLPPRASSASSKARISVSLRANPRGELPLLPVGRTGQQGADPIRLGRGRLATKQVRRRRLFRALLRLAADRRSRGSRQGGEAVLPPFRLTGRCRLPLVQMTQGRQEDAQRDHDFLRGRPAVVAVLLGRVSQLLAPGADDAVGAVRAPHPSAFQEDLVFLHRAADAAPAIAVPGAALGSALVDDMAMVGGNDQRPSGGPRFMQQRLQEPQVVQCPAQVQLVRAAEMIIHRVVDHAHHFASRVADQVAHRLGQARRIAQLAFVEQHGLATRLRCREQRRVGRESGLFLVRGTRWSAARTTGWPD